MNIKQIKTESDYQDALTEINRLFDAEEGTEEFDRLDILATLVEAYERKHHAIDAPDPIAAIEYAMEKRGMARRDLEPILGHSGRVSEVLNRQRALTTGMMRRLNRELNISADVLIREYPIKQAATKRRVTTLNQQ